MRHSPTNPLAQGHDIGLNPTVLISKQRPRTAHPGLNLIHNQQQIVFITQPTQLVHKLIRGGDDPTLALHRLDRKSTRLNSSHVATSNAIFSLKKKKFKTAFGT